MLLEAALDRIAELAESVPEARLHKFLQRVRGGQSLEAALLLESIRGHELKTILDLSEGDAFSREPALLAELLAAAYRARKKAAREPQIVWTGPRLEPTLPYERTSAAIRSLVDGARTRITIAGYHATSDTFARMGIWAAIARGVSVRLLVDGGDLKSEEKLIFMAKGVSVNAIAAAAADFTKFHAKAIVVDGQRALIGSANFTMLGHSANIEMGVSFEGVAAQNVERMINSYLQIAAATGWIVSK